MDANAVYLFVDNSNVWIEGKHLAGAIHGLQKGELWRLDFGKLIKFAARGRVVYDARMYGSRPPPNDSVWEMAKKKGFKTNILDRNAQNKEKGVDMELGMDVAETLALTPTKATLAIVAGDGDYHKVPERAAKCGWDVEFYFWSNAANRVKYGGTNFIELDKHLEEIGRWARTREEPDFEV